MEKESDVKTSTQLQNMVDYIANSLQSLNRFADSLDVEESKRGQLAPLLDAEPPGLDGTPASPVQIAARLLENELQMLATSLQRQHARNLQSSAERASLTQQLTVARAQHDERAKTESQLRAELAGSSAQLAKLTAVIDEQRTALLAAQAENARIAVLQKEQQQLMNEMAAKLHAARQELKEAHEHAVAQRNLATAQMRRLLAQGAAQGGMQQDRPLTVTITPADSSSFASPEVGSRAAQSSTPKHPATAALKPPTSERKTIATPAASASPRSRSLMTRMRVGERSAQTPSPRRSTQHLSPPSQLRRK